MQKIIPHLWFDKKAVEAAKFYISIFDDSRINFITKIYDTPSGDCDIVSFQIRGYEFRAISAGPLFKINPSISFHIKCKTIEEVDRIWEKLSEKGIVMMELGKYPFSKRYGWIKDKYGVSWQVIYEQRDFKQRITPMLMFVGDVCGKAEEALNFYTSVFPNSKLDIFARHTKGEEPDKERTVKYAQCILEGQEFVAMDSAHDHKFAFNEAISLIINCKDQKEIDYFWNKLSAFPKSEQCGWIKDKYGVSWQIVPENMEELISKNPKKTIPAMLKMKKISIADLKKAREEK